MVRKKDATLSDLLKAVRKILWKDNIIFRKRVIESFREKDKGGELITLYKFEKQARNELASQICTKSRFIHFLQRELIAIYIQTVQ